MVPFAKPSISDLEIEAVTRVLRGGWLTTGEECRAFEREFANRVEARHAVAVNSATAGLHLALEAMGIGPGDKVLVPTWTFTATAEVVHHVGATVEFADIDPRTCLLDLDEVEQRLTSDVRIRAVIPVHFAGQACDMPRLMRLAERHGVAVIEDAAHAFPATCSGRPIGSIGHATVFSFYATKTITTGEGGMVTTDDGSICERMKVMRLHGISRDVFDRYRTPGTDWHYEVLSPGYKYNLTDLAAALGRVQLQRAELLRQRRALIAARYREAFAGLPLRELLVRDARDLHAWHLFAIQLDENLPVDRNEFCRQLAQRGVGTSVHFIPLHMQPCWRDIPSSRERRFPSAESVYRRIVSLPIYASMDEADIDLVTNSVRAVVLDAANSQRTVAFPTDVPAASNAPWGGDPFPGDAPDRTGRRVA